MLYCVRHGCRFITSQPPQFDRQRRQVLLKCEICHQEEWLLLTKEAFRKFLEELGETEAA